MIRWLPVITTVSLLDREALVGVQPDAVEAMADMAMLRSTGARGPPAIMEEVLLHVMYEVPSREDVERVVITAEVIRDNALPTMAPRGKESPRKRRAPNSAQPAAHPG